MPITTPGDRPSIGTIAATTATPTTIAALNSSSGTVNWTQETLNFNTGSSTSEYITFATTLANSGPPVVFLDSVALACTTGCTTGGSSVPEPATLAVLGIGLAGMAGVRRRRRASIAA